MQMKPCLAELNVIERGGLLPVEWKASKWSVSVSNVMQ